MNLFIFLYFILNVFSNEHTKTWKDNLTFFPIIAYTPETSALLGAGTTYTFNLQNNSELKKSYTNLLLMLSLNKQSLLINTSEIKLKNSYLLRTKLLYIDFPDLYYGYGNNTLKDNEIEYTLNQLNIGFGFFKTFLNKFSSGLEFEYLHNSSINNLDIIGAENLHLFAFGPSVIWDTRDNLFFPKIGAYHQLSLLWYLDNLNKYEFSEFSFDFRKYFTIFNDDVFALQLYSSAYNGTVPFFKLSKLGDKNSLRGIYIGRYRDYNQISMQAEYRKMLTKKFAMVVFSGFGKVADNYENLFFSDYKYAYGTGLRYALNSKEKINLRFDLASGPDGAQVYFSYMEAF